MLFKLSNFSTALLIAITTWPSLLWANDDMEQPAAETVEMDRLVDEVVRVNPRLTAMERQVAALREKAVAVQTLMDPMIAVEYSNFPWNTWALGDSPMTGIQVKVAQTLPFPGKNERREATALAQAEVKSLEREELTVQLRAAVKQNYLALTLVRQLRGLSEEHIVSIEKLLARVRLRYEVGKGNQKDILGLELLGDKLEDELEDFASNDRELTASINSALHRDARTSIATPKESASVSPGHSYEQLLELARQYRPKLAVFEQRSRASKLAADQAEWERRPDFTVWLGYRFRIEAGMDDGTDFLSIGASVPLPFDFLDTADARKAGQLELAQAAQHGRSGALDDIAFGLEKSLAAWRRALSKEETYRETLVPQARRTLDAALLAYETDRTDFFSIYRAELDLIAFERTIRTARITTAKMKVAVEALVGTDLDAAAREQEKAR